MKIHSSRWLIAVVSAAQLLIGCGSDSDGSGNGGGGVDVSGITLPSNMITAQSHLTEAAFNGTSESAELASLIEAIKADGFQTFVGAGAVDDSDGNTAIWIAFSNPDGAEAGAVYACSADGTCATLRTSAEEISGVNFAGPDGLGIELPWTAAPSMLRDVAGQDHSGPTAVARAALTVDEVPEIDLSRRRIVIANTFGAAQGLDLVTWDSLAESTRAFSSVRLVDYATVETIRSAVRSASPVDALVWVGAGVREKLGNEYKTIGMTANRAIYGDTTVRGVEEIRRWLDENPYGGPGLVVLVGEETHGDGSAQANKPAAIFNEFSDIDTHRIVVAVQGRAEPRTVLSAAQTFLTRYFEGATLRDALDAGNEVFSSAGSAAKLLTNREGSSESITFPGALDAFFSADPPKSPVRSNMYLNIANVCIDSETGAGYSEEEGQVNFFVDVTFDGPFFEGSRQWEIEGEQLVAEVRGVMLGREPGAGVFLTFSGDVKPSVKGLTIWGAGAVEDRSDIDSPNRIFFDGNVVATEYQNAAGDTCQLKSPTLSGSTSEQLSWIDFDLPK